MKSKITLALGVLALAVSPIFGATEAEQAGQKSITAVRTVTPVAPRVGVQPIRGEVELLLNVDAKGRVVNVEVTRSTNSLLDEPTTEAVRDWKFEKAETADAPVRKVVLPVRYVAAN